MGCADTVPQKVSLETIGYSLLRGFSGLLIFLDVLDSRKALPI